jgi:hypothetical protein
MHQHFLSKNNQTSPGNVRHTIGATTKWYWINWGLAGPPPPPSSFSTCPSWPCCPHFPFTSVKAAASAPLRKSPLQCESWPKKRLPCLPYNSSPWCVPQTSGSHRSEVNRCCRRAFFPILGERRLHVVFLRIKLPLTPSSLHSASWTQPRHRQPPSAARHGHHSAALPVFAPPRWPVAPVCLHCPMLPDVSTTPPSYSRRPSRSTLAIGSPAVAASPQPPCNYVMFRFSSRI